MIIELKYENIDRNIKDIDKVDRIYTQAFPPEERHFTIAQVLEYEEKLGKSERIAAYDGDEVVGFYALEVFDEYKYLAFIAVDSEKDGRGYGSTMLRKILDDNKDVVLFAHIEKPVEGEENYETKKKRQHFYERNGMITVQREMVNNGITFIVVTNKTGETFDRCYQEYEEILARRLEFSRQL